MNFLFYLIGALLLAAFGVAGFYLGPILSTATVLITVFGTKFYCSKIRKGKEFDFGGIIYTGLAVCALVGIFFGGLISFISNVP